MSLRDMGLIQEMNKRRRPRVTDMLVSKEPDSSFAPRDRVDNDQWPSVVLECGWLGSLEHLRPDAGLWIARSRGDVKLVMLIGIDGNLSEIVVEKWVSDLGYAGRCAQQVTMTRDIDGQIIISGSPFVITFGELFCRPPCGVHEVDCVLGEDVLGNIAETVWSW
ncbi:hypothetical protein ASPCADRAFT_407702 [Aspergillus carbonarius ITEM 5010]|uniref:Uncharacterized protein n=1 Tax=Aspergillus carbonarius (strain ITEM 5010) TaxID=602072 RepID=A0A1R3RGD0_ASPC5|nr:hypothetical protein ASPCADRAFT_407702 [Aspergillus carbonarius ITEM 5010]